jgi:hypothetical protein
MRYLLLLVSVGLLSCSSPGHPDEYLDEETAAMVRSASAPMIFARAHQDVAANARQYANVVAASVNRAGRYEYLLLVYFWSTVDPRLGAATHPGDTLVILADERAIRLPRDGRTLKEAGIAKEPLRPLHAQARPRVYRTDRDTLLFISNARHVRLQLEGDQDARPFDLWKDGRRELGRVAAND